MRHLDPEAVQAFVLVADLKSFTRAARVLNTSQSAVSLRISRLEARLAQRLLARTPRLVRLSAAGEAFLPHARALVDAHRRATEAFQDRTGRLKLGISHHLVAGDLPVLLRSVQGLPEDLVLDLRVGGTRMLLDSYDAGELDAVLLLRHDESRREGELVAETPFQWVASPTLAWTGASPLPLVLEREPCQLRAMALAALARGRTPWREAFLGYGVASILAAAQAGLGVAAVARRVSPAALVDVGAAFGLPPLPTRAVVLHSNLAALGAHALLDRVVAAFRALDDHPERALLAAE